MTDPEERLCSGVQTCNDPLRGICCKAHCRTAEGGAESYDDNKMKIFNHMLMQYLEKILQFNTDFSYLCAGVFRVAVQISEHTCEGVDFSVNFRVIARWFFRTTVLTAEQQKKCV